MSCSGKYDHNLFPVCDRDFTSYGGVNFYLAGLSRDDKNRTAAGNTADLIILTYFLRLFAVFFLFSFLLLVFLSAELPDLSQPNRSLCLFSLSGRMIVGPVF